jgi:predicted RNA-binding protein with RPS1 domain
VEGKRYYLLKLINNNVFIFLKWISRVGTKKMYKKRSKSYNYFLQIGRDRDKKQDKKDLDKEYLRKKIQNLTVGQIIKGRVIKILDFGSVIEFDSIQGFLHISEISDEWIEHPSDVLSVNEIILAKIILKEIDKNGKYNIRCSTKEFKKAVIKQNENKPVRSNQRSASSKLSTEKPFNPPKTTNTKKSLQEVLTKKRLKNKEDSYGSSSYQYSEEERKLLDKHIDFYKSLDSGSRVPETEEQKHFVEVCQRQKEPKTVHEKAYIKFKKEVKEVSIGAKKVRMAPKKVRMAPKKVRMAPKKVKNNTSQIKGRLVTCSICGGDGFAGRCFKCLGSGWVRV